MRKYLETEESSRKKKQTFIKRSQTMQQQREEIRNSIKEKECRKCTKTKDISKFNKKSDSRDGFQPYCNKCITLIKKERSLK